MKRFISEGVVRKTTLSTKLASAFLLILSTSFLATSAFAAELVANGGFESPIVPTHGEDTGWATYYGENYPYDPDHPDFVPCDPDHPEYGRCIDDARVPGWAVFWTDDLINSQQLTPGRLEIQRGDIGGAAPLYGAQKAELDSHHRMDDDNTNVTIVQLLPTCPLTAYELSYGWKSRTEEEGDNDVRVYVNDDEVAIHEQNSDWRMEKHDFISDDSGLTLILFGSIGDETTKGMYLDEVSVTGPDGSLEEPCVPPVDTLICGDKPIELTLRYNGTYTSNHHQSGNEVIISPESGASFPIDATIEVFGHNRKNPESLGSFDVKMGGLFSVRGSHKRIPPRLTFKIYSSDDLNEPVQTVTFHTSCSQPMNAGDEFGAITVWSAIN